MILDLIPAPYRLLAGAAAVVAITASVWLAGDRHGLAKGRAETAVVQARWDTERAAEFAAAASASESARAEEQRRQSATQEIAHEAQVMQDRARRDAVAVTGAADGLRQRAAAVAAACRGGPSVNPTAAAGSTPATDSGAVLIDVLSRVVVVAGQLAIVADQRGGAGAACERAYTALTAP